MTVRSNARIGPVWLTAVVAVAGLVMVAIALVYLGNTAGQLPWFLPGHTVGSTRHHASYGIFCLDIGLIALAGSWMSLGCGEPP